MMKPVNTDQCEPYALLSQEYSAQSKVHEYGGGSYCVNDKTIYFVNALDQQIYFFNYTHTGEVTPPQALTKTLSKNHKCRYADLYYCPYHKGLFAVAEDHGSGSDSHENEPTNTVVFIKQPQTAHNNIQANDNTHTTINTSPDEHIFQHNNIHQGYDFYAYPRTSSCGHYFSCIAWNHPNMPWDNTQLIVHPINDTHHVGSNPDHKNQNLHVSIDTEKTFKTPDLQSVFQPQWSADGHLYFVSDKNNWWNIYRYSIFQIESIHQNTLTDTAPLPEAITNLEAEFATPLWTFAMSTYGFLNNQQILATYTQNGQWHLCTIDIDKNSTQTHVITPIDQSSSSIFGLSCDNDLGVFVGASATQQSAIHLYNPTKRYKNTEQKKDQVTQLSRHHQSLDIDEISIGKYISFESGGEYAHAFFYPPTNAHHTGDCAPPLITICHGGPTGQSENNFNYKIQYWTNRGFAILDVNYRGSTGYGREFRRSLYGRWGLNDVEDMVNASKFVALKGWASPHKKAIKGSSAGGYSVLCALAFTQEFSAGVSLYGIGDLELLVADTHKFEAHYLDELIGPYPESKDVYRQRSPIHYIEGFNCPLLLFQGLEDKVVPPNQAYQIACALEEKGIPVTHTQYANEGHGFRDPTNIEHMMETEQNFYIKVFDL